MKGLTLAALVTACTMIGDGTAWAWPGAGAAAAVADDVVVVDGATTVRIKHIEVAGSSLSSAELAALFATKEVADLEARLHALNATSILIPEITVDRSGPGDAIHATQSQVLLADIHAGRATTGSAAGATATVKGDKTDVTIKIGASTFKGLDLAQIVHLAIPAGAATDEPVKPLCDELSLNAVAINGASGDPRPVTIATMRETGLRGRPPTMRSAQAPSGGEAVKTSDEDYRQSFFADLVDISDVALMPATEPRELRSFTLKHAALSGFGDGKLQRFALDGLAVDSKAGALKVASMEILDAKPSGGAVPSIDRIDLRDAAIDVPADEAKPDARVAVTVAHAAYEAPGLVIGKLPPRAALVVEHVGFDLPANSAAAPMLMAMGYRHLDLSGTANSHYDAATGALTIDRFSLSGADMGTLDLKLGLANVSEGIVSQNDETQKAAAAAVVVKSLDLSLHNAGLVDKAIAFKAAVDGVGLDQERTNIAQLIDTGLVGFGLQGSAKAQAIVAALHKFVDAPRTLHLAFSSKEGLGSGSIALIADPQALLDALEVQADAGP